MFYFKFSALTFLVYLSFFMSDSTTPKNDLLSWVALFLVSLTFPISIPLSLYEQIS